jgi:hypothetical protein
MNDVSRNEYLRLREQVSRITGGGHVVWHDGNLNPADYLPLSGGTLTDSLNISKEAGSARYLRIKTGDLNRWAMGAAAVAETGGNAGADFYINRYNDAGGFLGSAMIISRATGQPTFAATPYVGSSQMLTIDNLPYAYGIWTPRLYGSTTAGSPVYSSRGGEYIRVGLMVFLRGYIVISSKGGMVGEIRIGDLPFAAGFPSVGSIGAYGGFASGMNPTGFHIDGGQNYLRLLLNGTSTSGWIINTSITDSMTLWGFKVEYRIQ